MRDHIEQLNRPMCINDLGSKWLPAIPQLHERLGAQPPARVLDIACGAGWSSVALALAYPDVRVDGVDADEASITRATSNAAGAGVGDRVHFHVGDAADLRFVDRGSAERSVDPMPAQPDAAFIVEALHDMDRPVAALVSARKALRAGAPVIIADEKVAERFSAPGDEIERLMYGFSITHCLPSSRTGPQSAATGTALRPDTVRAYAREAGFSSVDVLPIDSDMWRFYRMSDT